MTHLNDVEWEVDQNHNNQATTQTAKNVYINTPIYLAPAQRHVSHKYQKISMYIFYNTLYCQTIFLLSDYIVSTIAF